MPAAVAFGRRRVGSRPRRRESARVATGLRRTGGWVASNAETVAVPGDRADARKDEGTSPDSTTGLKAGLGLALRELRQWRKPSISVTTWNRRPSRGGPAVPGAALHCTAQAGRRTTSGMDGTEFGELPAAQQNGDLARDGLPIGRTVRARCPSGEGSRPRRAHRTGQRCRPAVASSWAWSSLPQPAATMPAARLRVRNAAAGRTTSRTGAQGDISTGAGRLLCCGSDREERESWS